jgi:DnaK suppressor protein
MKDQTLMDDYKPSEDEPYMNPRQLEYFRLKLLDWRQDILRTSGLTLKQLQEEDTRVADAGDWASAEIQRSFELRTRDRERKLLNKIGAALQRIEDGSYGYCEDTMEPIGLKRLEARPIATLTLEAQERHERRERTHRDD